MRKFLGIVLLVLGVPILLAGAAVAIYVGTDDIFDVANESVDTEAAALATSPSFLEITGPTLHVTADGGVIETFVGVAHPLHVGAYLDDVPYLEVTNVTAGRELTMLSRDGEGAAASGPVGLDWWSDTASGDGAQTVSLPLTDAPAQIVVMNADASAPLDLDLTVAAEVDGLFVTALIVVALGLILVVGGVLTLRSARRRKRAARKQRAHEAPSVDPEVDQLADDSSDTSTRPAPPKIGFDQLKRHVGAVPIAAGLVTLAGCASIPETVDREDAETVPAATTAQIEDFFTKYTKTNNAANAEFDADLISAVEGGALLAASEFSYAEAQAQGLDPIEPFAIGASTTARPTLDAYPMWYLAADEWDGETEGSTHYLVTRQDPTSPWLAMLSVSVSGDIDTPQPLLRDGRAQLADASVVETAGDIFGKLTAFAESGDEPDGIDVSNAVGMGGVNGLGIHVSGFSDDMGTVSIDCAVDEPDTVNWLATADGGAVAMASLSCTQLVELNDGLLFQVGEPYGTIPGDIDLSGTSAEASVSFIIGIDADGSATVIDDGAELTSTDYTEYAGTDDDN
jgi:hypothetical protein